ncbi:hypothetical protein [Flavobacterium pectinovorum]|uniref:hypothetical protein n=1 Tax=Flavobacterium pectinovorum TaxID=29533 RepID=UPI001FACACAD|nr:hypothetical protein [Flavobacterium pectinovorum]MCI9846887.1 hypothetical protein [Flavobacterium pectinovorum]
MKLKYIFALIFFFNYSNSFSCDCKILDKETMINKALKYSDIVFYGEVIKFNPITGTYSFKIIELFKGETNAVLVKGTNSTSCSITPTKKDLWIVYANFNNDKTISISQCSPSMGLESHTGSYPPPPQKEEYFNIKNKDIKSLYRKVIELEYEKENLTNWINQLERLRIYKSDQNTISEKEKADLKIETYAKYIIISLIITTVLLLVLIFVVLMKKKSKS